jgi:hypothetical protein
VSVQIPKGPLLRCMVLRRVHSLTHSFPSRQIPRESTQSAPPINTPNYVLPHTTPGHTHIGSWLYCFHGWLLHEPVLRFGYDGYHRLLGSTGQASNCRNTPNAVPNPSPQILISRIISTLKYPTGDNIKIIERNSTQTQTNSCKAKQYYPYTNYPCTMLRFQGRIRQF